MWQGACKDIENTLMVLEDRSFSTSVSQSIQCMRRGLSQKGFRIGQHELQWQGHDDLHPVSRHVRIGAVVEGRPNPGHYRSSKNELQLSTGQPRGARDHRLLPDNQPVDGIGARTSGSPAEEHEVEPTAEVGRLEQLWRAISSSHWS